MTEAQAVADNYITLWNEADADRRAALLDADWSADAIYCDPLMQGAGSAEIAGLIGAVHDQFPGFRFTACGAADGYGDHVRFSWALGPAGEPDMIKGTDFVRLENARIKSVTGFLDKTPEGS